MTEFGKFGTVSYYSIYFSGSSIHRVRSIYTIQMKCQYLLMNKITAIKSTRNGSEFALWRFSNTWSKCVDYWEVVRRLKIILGSWLLRGFHVVAIKRSIFHSLFYDNSARCIYGRIYEVCKTMDM